MKIEMIKVKSLGFGNKYCLMINGIPIMLCGRHKKDAVLQVAKAMEISNDVLLKKSEQGYIIAEIKKTLNKE